MTFTGRVQEAPSRSTRIGRSPEDDHERVVIRQDAATGMRLIVAVHSTVLGPALGGLRLRSYPGGLREALDDVLGLARTTGSGRLMNLFEVSKEIADRLVSTFTRDDQGRRPVYGGSEKFQTDPHWRDYILFYEYFHGDNGAGLGASHQTGWTGLVAKLIELYGVLEPERALEMGKKAAFEKRRQKLAQVKDENLAQASGHLRGEHLGVAE